MKKTNPVSAHILCALVSCTFANSNVFAKDDNLEIGGYIMLDHDSFDTAFLEDGDSSQSLAEIRRARLSFKSQFMKDWKTKFQIDLTDGNTEIKDAYLRYQGLNWADITLGKQKEAFGLEKLTSSRNLLMIERSMVSEALAPGRSLGISASGELTSMNWQLGYYQPEESESATAITGRLTWTPWQQDNNLVHLGVAFSERDLNGSEFRMNEQLEVNLSDSLLEGENLLADKVSLAGIEFLWQQNGFTTLAEWQQATVKDVNSSEYDYQGGYLQVSYQLSGDNRTYKNGSLGKVTTPGWELTSRYSQFELLNEDREAQTYSIGVNYTVNNKLKFMGDYIKAKSFEGGYEIDSGDAISLRAQYSF